MLKKKKILKIASIFIGAILLVGVGYFLVPKFFADIQDSSSSVRTKSWSGVDLSAASFSNTQVVNGNLRLAQLGSGEGCSDYNSVWNFGKRGTDVGQFDTVKSVVYKNGYLYVMDAGSGKIQRFKDDVLDAAWSLNTASDSPQGFDIDSNGQIYVVDTNNHRVQVFTSTGTFKARWGTNGSGNGNFSYPQGIVIDKENNIFIADTSNNRIQKFKSDGTFLAAFGTKGEGDGQLDSPGGITVDENGNVYVADTYNNRLVKYSNSGQFIAKWGNGGSGRGQFSLPSGVRASNGYLFVADTGNNRIQKMDLNGLVLSVITQGQFSSPQGITYDNQNKAIFVADTGNFRVQKLEPGMCYAGNWKTSGTGDGQVSAPTGLTFDADGNLFVADTGNNRIQKYDRNGNFLNKWTGSTGGYTFSAPKSVVVGADGNIYVMNSQSNKAQIMRSDGLSVSSITGFSNPSNLALDQSGFIYIADTGNNQVKKYSSAGGSIGSPWGTFGTSNGSFNQPYGIAIDKTNSLVYVSDMENNRIQKFSLNGEFRGTWGSKGSDPGFFNKPKGLMVDTIGNVYVVDSLNHRVQVFKSDGTFLYQFGSGDLVNPDSVAIASDGNMLVSDVGDNTIKRFSLSSDYYTRGTVIIEHYDSGMAGTIWKKLAWNTGENPSGSTIKAKIRTSDSLDDLGGQSWSNETSISNAPLSMPDNSMPAGRYVDIEFIFTSENSTSSPSIKSTAITYSDFLSGIVYDENKTAVSSGIKVVLSVNNAVKGATETDRNGRYHFGNLGIRPGNSIKIYLDSAVYAGAISLSGSARENLTLNIQGRNLPQNSNAGQLINVDTPKPGTSVSITPVPIYRFNSGKPYRYFYTISESEKANILKEKRWKSEGIIGYGYLSQTEGTLPVYRLYDKKNQRHFYTVSEYEKNVVLANDKLFTLEGIAFYTYPAESSREGLYEVYRFWNSLYRIHFYTSNRPERDKIKRIILLWKLEGIAFKVKPTL